MKKMFNEIKIEGYVYSHDFKKKTVQNKDSKNFGKEFIGGKLNIATDKEGKNVVTVNYSYVTPDKKDGTTNSNYVVLDKIISHQVGNMIEDGIAKAAAVRVDAVFEANDFVDKSSGEMISTFRAASSFNGGFIHLVDAVSPKATFHVDMLINKVVEKEADEEKGLAAKVDVAGCIFDWRGAIIPAHFTVLLPAAMDYFVNLGANEHNPVFTELQGVMENETYTVQTTKESAFGEDIVEETTRSRKQNVITWARPEPYEWDNEATLLGSEVATAMQNRELLLAEIASRATAAIEPKAKIYNF